MSPSDTSYIESLLPFYKQHVEKMILPFWLGALDYENGGIYTCFDNTGQNLISRDKFTWSQGRYLWAWSKVAAMTAENRLEGDVDVIVEHLRKTVHFLEKNAFLDNGNCAFLLTESGGKKESSPGKGYDTSIYADCFICLGLTGFAELTNDAKRFGRAVRLYHNIVQRVDTGNYHSEPYPVPSGYRAHSIPMILLHVSQELVKAAKSVGHPDSELFKQDSISYMKDIMENFLQADYNIAELLPDDPSDKNSLLARHLNPGHALESIWFVMHTARQTDNMDYIPLAEKAIIKAVNTGWDNEFGGLFRFVDSDGGKPKGEMNESNLEKMIADTWDMKLWWPHPEALYTALLGYQLTGNTQLLDLHHKIKNYTFKTFPNPDKDIGEWVQIRNRKGKPVDQVVALPVKDPFHILRSLLLMMDVLESELKTEKSKDGYG
jgi:N-acylglucosamine 2-epimerase